MAVNGKAWAHGSATHATRVLRNMVAAIMGQPMVSHANSATATTRGGSYGVVGGGDFLVTTTGGLGYSVAAGRIVAPGTFATAQGAYVGYNDAAVTGSFGARDATNPRIDYVAYKVRDTDEDATGSEDDSIVVIAGTPAGSPVAPTIASSVGTLVILSEVLVPSTANGGALQFTDRRMFASALGGIIRCKSTTRPTGAALWNGQTIFETDTGLRYHYNGAWCQDTPVILAYGATVDGTSGGRFTVQTASTTLTTNASGDGTITFPTPFLSTPSFQMTNGDTGSALLLAISTTPDATGCNFRAFSYTGAAAASYPVRINWTAIGFTA